MERHLPPTAASGDAGPGGGAGEGGLNDPRAMQILSVEHWSLLATRSMAWNEAFSRAGMFLTTLSGAVVALALVAQATAFGEGFVAAALVILPVVLLLGLATVIRLGQVNEEDLLCVQGMNRLRHAYMEIAPDLAPYFSTRSHDDVASVFSAFAVRPGASQVVHGLVTTPALVSIICSVLSGVIVALVAGIVSDGMVPTVVAGVVASIATWAALTAYGARTFGAFVRSMEIRFPPPDRAA
jgi:hypothetical protein